MINIENGSVAMQTHMEERFILAKVMTVMLLT